MKSRKIKIAITFTLMVTLLSVVGCGNGTSKTEDTKPTQTNVVSADPFGKYNPPINIEMVNQNFDPNGVKLKNGDTIGNDVYTRVYSDRLGINIKYRWTAVGEARDQKLNIMIASGDLPDIFQVNQIQYEKLVKSDKIADLTEVYGSYASDYTKKYYSGEYSKSLDVLKKDGKVYGLPLFGIYHENVPVIWIRSDWLKNLNLNAPKTGEELFNIAEAFTKKDPDGNTKDDTYGISLNNNINITAYWNMFHSYPSIWNKDSSNKLSQGMFGSQERIDATKAGLLKLQEFYKDGIIKKDFATMDSNKSNEDVVAGKCGIVFGGLWDGYGTLFNNVQKDPKADWIPIAVPSVDANPATVSTDPVSIFGIFVVKKESKNPEALVKMINLFHNLNNNPETMEFAKYNTDAADGNAILAISPIQVWNPIFNIEGFRAIKDVNDKKIELSTLPECYKMFYDQMTAFTEKNDRAQWSAISGYSVNGSVSVAEYYIKNKSHVLNEFTGVPTKGMQQKQPQIDKLWNQLQPTIIMGGSISEFDKFISDYKSAGGDQITQEVNDWYAQQDK